MREFLIGEEISAFSFLKVACRRWIEAGVIRIDSGILETPISLPWVQSRLVGSAGLANSLDLLPADTATPAMACFQPGKDFQAFHSDELNNVLMK